MAKTDNSQLKIAKLEYHKGDFVEASLSAKKAAQETLAQGQFGEWLEALRILLQCCFERDSLNDFETWTTPLQQFDESTSDNSLKASAHHLIAHYQILKRNEDAEKTLSYAMALSTLSQNLECLARCFALAATLHVRQNNIPKTLEYLDKLDIMIKELSLDDLLITSLVVRSYVHSSRRQFDRAQELIWQAYERAGQHGHQLAIPSILAQIAYLQREQGALDLYQMYAELAMRGVNELRHPRLYREISQYCTFTPKKAIHSFDFVLDETQNQLHEKEKGYLDFRNQHILLELAILFLKHPGTRFSKEDLIEIIWKQAYDPDIHDNLIYVSIKRLRLLLEPNSESPKYILRDRKGYYLTAQTQVQIKNREETKA